ncbi:MAG: FecR domain-containing protein [Blastocatellia bacterium]|nr:FecR domain-containing protein [Blastocatellia bacterium]
MKMTDSELNNIVDDVTAEIRGEKLDSAVVEGVSHRVWKRLAGEEAAVAAGWRPVEQIRNCDDFQALIPAYLQGYLSSARTTLLEDHTRECVPCRKAMKQARHGNQEAIRLREQMARAAATNRRASVLRWAVAAVLVAGLGLFAWPWIQRSLNSLQTLSAVVEAAQGGVYKVTGDKTQAVRIGEKLLRGERIRTAKSSSAVMKLSDGTLVEMRERSEFSVNDATAGATINLERGQVIVQAAKQRSDRKLFVQTDDSLVSVTGTIFSVNSGAKGARVSVIEGEVHVDNAGKTQVLHAGDQTTTHDSIDRVPVREEIAWSRDADRYVKMLDAIRSQIDQQLAMPGNRYSTRLLDLVSGDTALYIAIPNIGETLARANDILQENLQQNSELRDWWEQEQKESNKPASKFANKLGGRRQGLNQAIELMREFGSYLGDEIVIAASANPSGSGGPGEPVLLAEVKDGGAFHGFLEGQLEKFNSEKRRARIIDDPMNIASGGSSSMDEFFIWITDGLVAVSPRQDSLKSLAARVRQGARPFTSTPFYAQIANLYRDGAGLVIAADLDRIVIQSLRKEKDAAAAAQQLGVTDLRYFIVEIKEKDGKPYNRAVVSFRESQHGITSWLAQPGPMGALEFISPDASVVAAFVVKEPTALVDDLFETLKQVAPDAWEGFQKFQAERGIDLRNDFVAPLGSEYAVTLDGPALPVPSVKAVFQVDDQQHLQQSLERLVEMINAELAGHGKKGLAWAKTESGGRVFYTLKSLDYGLEMDYTYAYGYFIAAPSRALVENAIKYKESGHTLLGSPKFKATLPEDKQVSFSAMVYQNAGSILQPAARIVAGAAGDGAPSKLGVGIKGLPLDKAGLAYVYALNDRMVMSVNSEDGPVGLSPSDLLGLPGSSGLGRIVQMVTH